MRRNSLGKFCFKWYKKVTHNSGSFKHSLKYLWRIKTRALLHATEDAWKLENSLYRPDIV